MLLGVNFFDTTLVESKFFCTDMISLRIIKTFEQTKNGTVIAYFTIDLKKGAFCTSKIILKKPQGES